MVALLACEGATGPALDPGERCGTAPAAVPAFVDPALATTVRAALDLDGAEPLTCAAAASLRSLKAEFAGIPVPYWR